MPCASRRSRHLDATTWDAFVDLAKQHTAYGTVVGAPRLILPCAEKDQSTEGNHALKERVVGAGKAHAALVLDGDVAVAWCEYGAPDEIPSIYHLKDYTVGLEVPPTTASRASSST